MGDHPDRSGRLLEREAEKALSLLDRVIRRREVRVLGAALRRRVEHEGLTTTEAIRNSMEYRDFLASVWMDPEVMRVFDVEWLSQYLAVLAGADEEVGPMVLRQLPSIRGAFIYALGTAEHVRVMRRALQPGQIWLRFDRIPSDHLHLAAAFAEQQRSRAGLAKRPRGRRPGTRPSSLLDFEAQLDLAMDTEAIHRLAVEAGLRSGPFDDPENPSALDQNRRWVYARRSAARRRLREDQP